MVWFPKALFMATLLCPSETYIFPSLSITRFTKYPSLNGSCPDTTLSIDSPFRCDSVGRMSEDRPTSVTSTPLHPSHFFDSSTDLTSEYSGFHVIPYSFTDLSLFSFRPGERGSLFRAMSSRLTGYSPSSCILFASSATESCAFLMCSSNSVFDIGVVSPSS